MKKFNLAIVTLLLLLISIISTSAQKKAKSKENIKSSLTAYVFDEFYTDGVSVKEQKKRLKVFALKVKNTPNAHGDIYLYRGATDYKFDFNSPANIVFNYLPFLAVENKITSFNISGYFGGFRDKATIEMIFQPEGSVRRPPTSNISLLDVKYSDDKDLEKGTIQLTGRNLLKNLIKKVEPRHLTPMPGFNPATEAGILIRINENGKVTDTAQIVGSPLLLKVCENAVKQWQFKPEKRDDIGVKVIGIAVCDFKSLDK